MTDRIRTRIQARTGNPGPRRTGIASEAQGVTEPVDAGELFSAHAPFLYRVLERLCGPGDHLDDLVQEVFLTAHRRRADLTRDSDLRGWLYRVAMNLVRHHRRSFARRRALQERVKGATPSESQEPRQEAALASRQMALAVRACVDKLPLKQREVFVLFELEGLEGPAIARLMGIPENTVWSRLHHARKRFEKVWRANHETG